MYPSDAIHARRAHEVFRDEVHTHKIVLPRMHRAAVKRIPRALTPIPICRPECGFADRARSPPAQTQNRRPVR